MGVHLLEQGAFIIINKIFWETQVSKIFVTGSLQFNSHKSVPKLFHNLYIIVSNSLMGFKVICPLEKEPLKGLARVKEIFFKTFSFGDRLTIEV